MFLGILDPTDGHLQYASCGHPPPLVIDAARQHAFLPLTPGGLLGSAAAPPRAESTLLQPGEVLLVYSDGLVERPGHSLRDGMTDRARVAADAMRRATADLMAQSAAERVCELAMERLTRTGHADDVTLLAVELTGSAPEMLALELPAQPEQLGALLNQLGSWLDGLNASDEDVSSIQLAVLEAASNVVEHAYLDGEGSVRLEGHLDSGGRACLTLTDRGQWCSPQADPGQRGRGLQMIRGCMDTVEIDSSPVGTAVLMDRKLHRPVVLRSSPPDSPPRRRIERPFTAEVIRSEQPRVVIGGPVDVHDRDRAPRTAVGREPGRDAGTDRRTRRGEPFGQRRHPPALSARRGVRHERADVTAGGPVPMSSSPSPRAHRSGQDSHCRRCRRCVRHACRTVDVLTSAAAPEFRAEGEAQRPVGVFRLQRCADGLPDTRQTICHAAGMTVKIAVKLDDSLAEQVKAAAADAGTNLSEWVRAALKRQAAVAKAVRARAEEDARGPVYTDEQEASLMAARHRRAIAALDEQ